MDFKAVLDAPDRDAIVLHVVNREINDVMYERPAAWFAYLNERAKLGCPSADEIDHVAEAKATRDVLVHNRGVATRTYVAKAGRLARHADGDTVDLDPPYHRRVWSVFLKVVADVSGAAALKAA